MRYVKLLYFIFLFVAGRSYGQVHIEGNFAIDSGAEFTTPVNVLGNGNVFGEGTMVLNGSTVQNLDFNNYTIPNLKVNNSGNIVLNSNVTIGLSLVFAGSKIKIGGYDLNFSSNAKCIGNDAMNYIVTDGAGIVSHSLQQNDTFLFPVGQSDAANDYTPAFIVNKIGLRGIDVQVKNYASSSANVHNAASGVDRTWQITSDIAGDGVVGLTHNPSVIGSAFNNSAAFVTQQMDAAGTHWSTGIPVASVNNTHSGIFTIPEIIDPTAFFSKSSDATYALGSVPGLVNRTGQPAIDVQVAPNPFTDEVWLNIHSKAGEKFELIISDIQGKIIIKEPVIVSGGNYKKLLLVDKLSSGMYYLQVNNETVNTCYKIVKQ